MHSSSLHSNYYVYCNAFRNLSKKFLTLKFLYSFWNTFFNFIYFLKQQRRQKGRALGDGVVGSDGFPQRRQDQIKYTDEDEKVAFSSDSDYERVDDGDDGSSVTTFICCYHGYPCELAKRWEIREAEIFSLLEL